MKRLFIIFLSVLMALSLLGCHSDDSNAIHFYYCRDPEQYQYFEEDGVIRSESRDLPGRRNDLRYMVGLYLAGPMDEGLISPFSRGTILLGVEKTEDVISIALSDHSKSLTDSEFALACASLTLTCMDFTPCREVTIISGERTVTMNSDNIILFDALPQQDSTGG